MKTKENMSMSEMMNFDKEVVNFINDNLEYIRENAFNTDNEDLAAASLDHYNMIVEACNETENYLSEEQKERFYHIAKRLLNNGYVEHAGSLND